MVISLLTCLVLNAGAPFVAVRLALAADPAVIQRILAHLGLPAVCRERRRRGERALLGSHTGPS